MSKEEDLELDDDDLEIIRKQKLKGRTFLKITKEELQGIGLTLGPAKDLADFAKECKDKKLKAFSSYKTKADLEKVLQEDYKSRVEILLLFHSSNQLPAWLMKTLQNLSSALMISFAR